MPLAHNARRCAGLAATQRRSRSKLRFKDRAMDTYILLGGGFGLALLIAIWGIWKLR
jgi:hypothetical protein